MNKLMLSYATEKKLQDCHPERSEGSHEILRAKVLRMTRMRFFELKLSEWQASTFRCVKNGKNLLK